MKQLAEDIFLLEGLQGANSYLLTSGSELTLIDTGIPADAKAVQNELKRAGYPLSQLNLIILTHGHADHAGGTTRLADHSPAEIAAHTEEISYLRKEASLPFRSSWKQALFWISDRVLLPRPPLNVNRPLQEGDQLKVLEGLEVIHTPGHTPGSISLFQPERRILFCGDALFLAHPLTGKSGLRLPLKMVSVDPDLAYQSAVKILDLEPNLLCPGHGEPILRDAAGRIQQLLEGQG